MWLYPRGYDVLHAVFYVGKGKGSRDSSHDASALGGTEPRYVRMRSLQNGYYTVRVADTLSNTGSLILEGYLIRAVASYHMTQNNIPFFHHQRVQSDYDKGFLTNATRGHTENGKPDNANILRRVSDFARENVTAFLNQPNVGLQTKIVVSKC